MRKKEINGGDAHVFSWVYQHLKIGKLAGMPVPGTGTAVWWETQQDPTLVFGIPQVGFLDEQGHFLEKTQVEPDVKVPNNPRKVREGEDQQLEKAVEILMNCRANWEESWPNLAKRAPAPCL